MEPSTAFLLSHKLHLQLTCLTLAVLTAICAIGRIATSPSQLSRLTVWLLVVPLKSIVILAYELTTERLSRFQRWRSTKAAMILNCLEAVFWFAAFVISCMGVSKSCQGGSCAFGVFYILFVLVLCPLVGVLAVVSVRQHREQKMVAKNGVVY